MRSRTNVIPGQGSTSKSTTSTSSSSTHSHDSHSHSHDSHAGHSHGIFGGGHHHDHSEGAGEIIAALTGEKKDKGSRITLLGE